jgi:hypothetical protein
MDRITAGQAHCPLCGETIRPDEDALLTPDFLADDTDPLWRFNDCAMHRACFLVWDQRKAFVARYNQLMRRWSAPRDSELHMTSEGDVILRSKGVRYD